MTLFHKHNLNAVLLAIGLPVAASYADNVDVSTIPQRDTVQLTIYNSEDLTLVRETRHITFSKGDNPLQFSWANTLIDPTSVDLRFKTHAQELDILDTTFPHDKPQMLYWNVQSDFNGSAVVEISYFTSGITWAADYVCVADTAEEQMSFDGFVRITNNSGEDYENAQVRLVVGQINLVERIADLARRGLVSEEDFRKIFGGGKVRHLKSESRSRVYNSIAWDMNKAAQAPKAIVKQGLSEYFIFTIEGTETIAHTWSKRLRLFQGASVPFKIKYRYRPAEYGNQLVRLFILRNDEASSLGETPLPDGVVRLFRDNGRDGLSFLTAYSSKYVPIGQEIELNLGSDPQVIYERLRLRSWRDDFWFRTENVKTYFSPTQGQKIRNNYPVGGWDEHEQRVERIRNYRDKAIEVEIRLSFQGHVVFTSELDPKLHDYRSPQFSAQIKSAESKDLEYEITYHQGINRKQDNVTLEALD
ncbi:MAG: DUF4139 domain-containing protein [Planctomycetes bacterium]|nr:DUF4139 domain-containing protein [Planctomycetota bacterium]